VLTFYLLGALEMFTDGHSIEDIDAGARRVGWPIGPLALIDALGVDVGVSVSRIMATAYPKRAHIVECLETMAKAKRLGRWSGQGFYLHDDGEIKPDPQLRAWLGLPETRRSVDPEELGDRLTIVAALEAVRCLQEGIIASPRDGDVAAVVGLGYPRHRGGPFRHLAARGLSSIRSRLAALEDRFGPRYEAPRLLTELAGAGRDFDSLEVPA
jgi:3-hydroxyacyl-CoA dehydrogenase/enoyl-CoA hydratase/3-hydroxybutyryl-CoA epimerase